MRTKVYCEQIWYLGRPYRMNIAVTSQLRASLSGCVGMSSVEWPLSIGFLLRIYQPCPNQFDSVKFKNYSNKTLIYILLELNLAKEIEFLTTRMICSSDKQSPRVSDRWWCPCMIQRNEYQNDKTKNIQ